MAEKKMTAHEAILDLSTLDPDRDERPQIRLEAGGELYTIRRLEDALVGPGLELIAMAQDPKASDASRAIALLSECLELDAVILSRLSFRKLMAVILFVVAASSDSMKTAAGDIVATVAKLRPSTPGGSSPDSPGSTTPATPTS